jgi:predicted methyltransferase
MRRIGNIFKTSFSKVASLVLVCSVALAIGCRKHAATAVSAGDHRHHPFTNPEGLAAKWNDPGRDEWQHPHEIVASLALEPGSTVADIGAGTGYMVAHLSKAVGERGRVVAIDASAAMIEYLSGHTKDLGPATIVPQKTSNANPDLKNDSLDGVLTLDTWHHIGGREAYAKKVYMGLKRGGRFVVVDHDFDATAGPPKEMRLRSEQVSRELEAAGFRVETLRESMPSHFMVVGHKEAIQ